MCQETNNSSNCYYLEAIHFILREHVHLLYYLTLSLLLI